MELEFRVKLGWLFLRGTIFMNVESCYELVVGIH